MHHASFSDVSRRITGKFLARISIEMRRPLFVVCCGRLLLVEFSNSFEDPASYRVKRGHLHEARREPANSFHVSAYGPLVKVTKDTHVRS